MTSTEPALPMELKRCPQCCSRDTNFSYDEADLPGHDILQMTCNECRHQWSY
jgi:hypothetical protein